MTAVSITGKAKLKPQSSCILPSKYIACIFKFFSKAKLFLLVKV